MALSQEALVRSIGVESKSRYMVLLGAGASASSGVPTAAHCVWEWKRDIYLSNNPHIDAELLTDVSLPTTRQQIQRWIDAQGNLPEEDSPDEYSFFIEHTYPTAEGRRAYFHSRFRAAAPQTGYRLLAYLQERGFFPWVWTTNFDSLLPRARKSDYSRPLVEVGLDTVSRLDSALPSNDCAHLVHLHGDYRYDRISNTDEETQALDQKLREELIARVRTQPLLVVGYGGRDGSIMDALFDATTAASRGGAIYWCTLAGEELPEKAKRLLDKARANGFQAAVVEIDGFDDFMIRVARYTCRDEPEASQVRDLIGTEKPTRAPFELANATDRVGWIRSNGYPIELPRELYQVDAPDIEGWAHLRELTSDKPVVAGLLKGKVLALGHSSDIAQGLRGFIEGSVQKVPLDRRDYGRSDTVTMHIMLQAFCQAMAKAQNLKRRGRSTLWDPSESSTEFVGGKSFEVYPAAFITFTFVHGQHYLNVLPDLHVEAANGQPTPEAAIRSIKHKRLGRQWNREYHEALTEWEVRLGLDNGACSLSYPPQSERGFQFSLSYPPGFARILRVRRRRGGDTPETKDWEAFDAIRLEEPRLVFARQPSGARPPHAHPFEGLLDHGPYDLQLTQAGLYEDIRLGVVCPRSHTTRLASELAALLRPHGRVETKQEYLVAYPGFQQAYRVPLVIPQTETAAWQELPDLQLDPSAPEPSQRSITTAVTRAVDRLRSAVDVNVVAILVPDSWAPYERVQAGDSLIDLHDYVKAFCVQQAVPTQFIRDRTFDKTQQCEVLWWLAQALYVKSLRTPFVLDTQEQHTVFVGISYAYSRERDPSIILGCSHIYDAAGQGLRYRLSRIRNPVWIHRNPYLTKDQALGVGLQARQLFYETYQRLPERVVVHKRTPFRREEREGLFESLGDVTDVEMLTIEEESAWRFVAGAPQKGKAARFPVKRGTILPVGRHRFLLWVHGSVREIKQGGRTYYQGGSRIPTPLKVTRFAGHSPIETVAQELLGLSKMDWNNCDLYNQLPATLDSSRAIAKIGRLLERFGPETYDYRLFM